MDLHLYVPQYHELSFREALLADPASMSWNRGGSGADDYDPATGCIAFPRNVWALWYDCWIDREPERFYAYVVDGTRPVGEVCWYRDEAGATCAGIILKAEERGKGYCAPALKLLAQKAFCETDIERLEAEFSTARTAAVKGYTAAGFHVVRRGGGSCRLTLKKPSLII